MNKTDSAFPLKLAVYAQQGLTKREYFAARALQGIVTSQLNQDSSQLKTKFAAYAAVACADELIAALAYTLDES